jgi:hypothetical protein
MWAPCRTMAKRYLYRPPRRCPQPLRNATSPQHPLLRSERSRRSCWRYLGRRWTSPGCTRIQCLAACRRACHSQSLARSRRCSGVYPSAAGVQAVQRGLQLPQKVSAQGCEVWRLHRLWRGHSTPAHTGELSAPMSLQRLGFLVGFAQVCCTQ